MNNKIPFQISAEQDGTRALIRITGVIGWDTQAEIFRSQVDELISKGVKDVHIYINSPGGSCFDAAEICNILSGFGGKVTGAGGALVASAATFIALHCETFTLPANAMFMIHKPSGGIEGTADKVESYLKLLRSIEKQYYDKYSEKATDKAEFEKYWVSSDWWLTADEAKQHGFITSVNDKTIIDSHTAAIITACGCPSSKLPLINNSRNMDLKQMASALGLSDSATEADIKAAIEAGQKAQQDLHTLQAETKKKEEDALKAKIKQDVETAVKEKRITADVAPKWEAALAANYDTNIVLLSALQPVEKIRINPGKTTFPGATVSHQGKTFEQLQEEDPDALADLQANDPEAYDDLFKDYLKRNKLQ